VPNDTTLQVVVVVLDLFLSYPLTGLTEGLHVSSRTSVNTIPFLILFYYLQLVMFYLNLGPAPVRPTSPKFHWSFSREVKYTSAQYSCCKM